MVREKHSSVGKAPHKNHGDVSSILTDRGDRVLENFHTTQSYKSLISTEPFLRKFWIYSINDTIVQYAFSRQEQNTIQRKPGSLHLTKINYDTMM